MVNIFNNKLTVHDGICINFPRRRERGLRDPRRPRGRSNERRHNPLRQIRRPRTPVVVFPASSSSESNGRRPRSASVSQPSESSADDQLQDAFVTTDRFLLWKILKAGDHDDLCSVDFWTPFLPLYFGDRDANVLLHRVQELGRATRQADLYYALFNYEMGGPLRAQPHLLHQDVTQRAAEFLRRRVVPVEVWRADQQRQLPSDRHLKNILIQILSPYI